MEIYSQKRIDNLSEVNSTVWLLEAGAAKDEEHDRALAEQAEKDKEHDRLLEAGATKDKEHDRVLAEQAEKDKEHDRLLEAGVAKDEEQDHRIDELIEKINSLTIESLEQKKELDLLISRVNELKQITSKIGWKICVSIISIASLALGVLHLTGVL